MGQERLSSLALINIHYQVKIDLDEVVNLFATKHPRRLELLFSVACSSCVSDASQTRHSKILGRKGSE